MFHFPFHNNERSVAPIIPSASHLISSPVRKHCSSAAANALCTEAPGTLFRFWSLCWDGCPDPHPKHTHSSHSVACSCWLVPIPPTAWGTSLPHWVYTLYGHTWAEALRRPLLHNTLPVCLWHLTIIELSRSAQPNPKGQGKKTVTEKEEKHPIFSSSTEGKRMGGPWIKSLLGEKLL